MMRTQRACNPGFKSWTALPVGSIPRDELAAKVLKNAAERQSAANRHHKKADVPRVADIDVKRA